MLRRSALILTMLVLPASAQVQAPQLRVTNVASLPAPLPLPYDEKADAEHDVAAAFQRAKASGKRVLIDFGGNWCPDCRVLMGVMTLPEMQAFLKVHYEVVTVDIGMFNKNLQIPARFGIAKLTGVPSIIVAEPDGKPLNSAQSAELADARSMTPSGIAAWLARWAKP